MPLGAWRLITWLVLSAAKALLPATRRAKVMASVWTVLIMELLIVRLVGDSCDLAACRAHGQKPRDPVSVQRLHKSINFFRNCITRGTTTPLVLSTHHYVCTEPPSHRHIWPIHSRASPSQHGNLPCLPILNPPPSVLTSARAFTRPRFPKTASSQAT